MTEYVQTVSFDPCSLREHVWQTSSFGLANLTKIKTCSRCGATSYPRFEAAGIERGAWADQGKITIVGNTPTTGGNLTAADYDRWLDTIPQPIESEKVT